jgi:hypothetical protein
MDDVLVHGMNQNLHDTRLEAILQKLKETGITLNAEKCEFSRNKVKFIGHIIDADGIHFPSNSFCFRTAPKPNDDESADTIVSLFGS